MQFFKKKEPLIVADMTIGALPIESGTSASSYVPATGGLGKMLEETLALERENNRILKHMQTWDHIALWIKILVWALVLGLPVLFFQPLVSYLKQAILENPAMIGLPSSADFYKVVDQFSTKYPLP